MATIWTLTRHKCIRVSDSTCHLKDYFARNKHITTFMSGCNLLLMTHNLLEVTHELNVRT